MLSAWLWSLLLVGGTVLLSIAGTLLVRRFVGVEVLERHNEVAGFIYAVLGVVYAVLLGFAAITVWERYDRAQASVAQEANDLADLYRMRKLSRVTFVQSLEVKSATMFGLQFRKSGQLWLMASQARKFRTLIFSYG